MIYILYWYLTGVASAILNIYLDWKDGLDLDGASLIFYFALALLGPLVLIAAFARLYAEFIHPTVVRKFYWFANLTLIKGRR